MSRSFVILLVSGVLLPTLFLGVSRAQQKAPSAMKHVAHSSRGPHGGELLEIGKEEYHAELVVDETRKQILVYLLDVDAKSSLPINEPFLMVNLIVAGKPMQIQLKAIPHENDPQGQSSCFGVVSVELMNALHSPKSDPKLATRIRNKSYVTKIVHKHDHAGHNHAQQSSGTLGKRR